MSIKFESLEESSLAWQIYFILCAKYFFMSGSGYILNELDNYEQDSTYKYWGMGRWDIFKKFNRMDVGIVDTKTETYKSFWGKEKTKTTGNLWRLGFFKFDACDFQKQDKTENKIIYFYISNGGMKDKVEKMLSLLQESIKNVDFCVKFDSPHNTSYTPYPSYDYDCY